MSVIEGTTRMIIGDREYSLGAGDSLVLPASIPHSVEALNEIQMLLEMIKVPKTGV